jgi:hypothetical protein
VPTSYLLCGKIAAGTSTLAHRLVARPLTLLISEDHWTSNKFADDLRTIGQSTTTLFGAASRCHGSAYCRYSTARPLRSIWCGPRASPTRCSRHDLQAELRERNEGWQAPVPSKQSEVRSVNELFRASRTQPGLQRHRSHSDPPPSKIDVPAGRTIAKGSATGSARFGAISRSRCAVRWALLPAAGSFCCQYREWR